MRPSIASKTISIRRSSRLFRPVVVKSTR